MFNCMPVNSFSRMLFLNRYIRYSFLVRFMASNVHICSPLWAMICRLQEPLHAGNHTQPAVVGLHVGIPFCHPVLVPAYNACVCIECAQCVLIIERTYGGAFGYFIGIVMGEIHFSLTWHSFSVARWLIVSFRDKLVFWSVGEAPKTGDVRNNPKSVVPMSFFMMCMF